ncbi:MAG: lysine 5,6-aminomutase subunit alpha TIM-barrel domain-containing protein [Bacillota bacterium]|jgi:beta-lysine 5,6-aminomutase alpha subunit|nr:D-lysine 5,6-aminomutase subunit alpha [Candidatus Fermentithermobacillaceae bacterium]
MLRLEPDRSTVGSCHRLAESVARSVNEELAGRSTVTIERTVARLFGVDGLGPSGIPLANTVVDHLISLGKLEEGVALRLANASLVLNATPAEVAEKIAAKKVDLGSLPWHGTEACRAKAGKLAAAALERIKDRRLERQELLNAYPVHGSPWLYVIVATGDIHEDIIQARMAAAQGADVIAVIRSTGQSLLDYVPHGATREGYGGTYATQENFRLMREALDEESKRLGRYIRLVNYCSGLCMPEIAAMGALERLDIMLNDAMYGILFRDINAERTLVDQRFSRMINAYAGIIINTGEDNYLTTVDALSSGHSVVASQFMNYHFAKLSGLPDEQIGLGHAFEIDPNIEDSLLLEIAGALLVRELFPSCPVKYMPPTVHKTGDIFFAHALDAAFNLVSTATGQTIHLVGMLTEAVHTPLLQDRYASIRAAAYARKSARHLRENLRLEKGGKVERRAAEILDKALSLLGEVESKGLFRALEDGVFAGIRRKRDGGKGLEGVFTKGPTYFNPIEEGLRRELGI